MSKDSKKDTTLHMTSGSPIKLILAFLVPLLAGLVFQQCYSLVDSMIVGKCLGKNALAAVGCTGSINFLIIGASTGVCNGFAIPLAQRFGAEDYEGLRRVAANILWLSISFAVGTTVVVSLACRWILTVMQTPDNIIDQAYIYILIIFLGIPVTYLYNMTAAMIRAVGDSKTPVYFLIMASLINIALDYTLIKWCKMGVEGAAIATVASQLIAGIACFIFLIKKFDILIPKKGEWSLDGQWIKKLCVMGVPMGLQYSITAIGSVILQSSVNCLGSDSVAAVTAANKLVVFLICPFDALGSTMATYCGQNVGAWKLKRIKQGLGSALIVAAIYALAALVILHLAASTLLLLFVSADETALIAEAVLFIKIETFFFFPLAIVNSVRFSIQGMGFSSISVFSGVSEMIARGVFGLLVVPMVGFVGVCFASPFAWLAADCFLIPTFFYVYKKLEKNGPII